MKGSGPSVIDKNRLKVELDEIDLEIDDGNATNHQSKYQDPQQLKP